jgi:hypothetical protein
MAGTLRIGGHVLVAAVLGSRILPPHRRLKGRLAMTAAVIPSQSTLLTSNEGSGWSARGLGAQRADIAASVACAREAHVTFR